MVTVYWIGKADAVAQIVHVTPGGTIGAETFALSLGNAQISYTAAPGDAASDVAQGLRDAWNASIHPWFAAVTASEDAGVLVLTADVPGVPFEAEAQASSAATLSSAIVQASAGPNDWSTPGNWSGGAAPTDGDTVVIEHCADAIFWGLDQSAVTLAELRIAQSFTGVIGLPESAFTQSIEDADDGKPEYRPTYLTIGAEMVHIGEGTGNGSPRIKVNTGTQATELNIVNTAATSADHGLEPVRWIGSHADNVVNIVKGRLGIATTHAGETATIATLNQLAGEVTLRGIATTINQSGGTLVTQGDATLGDLTIGGSACFNAVGTITTLRVTAGGSADISRDPREKTITTCQLHRGATLNLSNGNPLSITITNDIEFIHCEPRDTTLITGPHLRVCLAAI